VDVIHKVVFEEIGTLNLPLDPLETCLLGTLDKRIEAHLGDEREVYTQILDMAQPLFPEHHQSWILNVEVGPSKKCKKCTFEVEAVTFPYKVRVP